MDTKKFQEVNALRSGIGFNMPVIKGETDKEIILRLCLGLAGEAAEVGQDYRKILEGIDGKDFETMLVELSDTVTYAFLLAEAIGGDLMQTVFEKFNEVSDKLEKKKGIDMPRVNLI